MWLIPIFFSFEFQPRKDNEYLFQDTTFKTWSPLQGLSLIFRNQGNRHEIGAYSTKYTKVNWTQNSETLVLDQRLNVG